MQIKPPTWACFSHPPPLCLMFHIYEKFYLFLKHVFCRSSKPCFFFSVSRGHKKHHKTSSPMPFPALFKVNTSPQLSLGPLVPVQEMLWRILSHSPLFMNCCLALLDWFETWLSTLPLPDCSAVTSPTSACPAQMLRHGIPLQQLLVSLMWFLCWSCYWLLAPKFLWSSPAPAHPYPSGFTHTSSAGCLHSFIPITAAQKPLWLSGGHI